MFYEIPFGSLINAFFKSLTSSFGLPFVIIHLVVFEPVNNAVLHVLVLFPARQTVIIAKKMPVVNDVVGLHPDDFGVSFSKIFLK